MVFDLLVKMQPSRKRRKEGEVFVIQPKEGLYYFGKVVRTKIPSKAIMVNGWHLIYIYDYSSHTTDIPKDLSHNSLLIAPHIVNNQGWLKGYFQTVDIQPVTENERKVDYGFWDIKTKEFVNEEGKSLRNKPRINGDFGIGSYGSVADEVKKVLDPSFEG